MVISALSRLNRNKVLRKNKIKVLFNRKREKRTYHKFVPDALPPAGSLTIPRWNWTVFVAVFSSRTKPERRARLSRVTSTPGMVVLGIETLVDTNTGLNNPSSTTFDVGGIKKG